MSFYENQDDARKQTYLLIGYFLLAVVLIVGMVNIAVYAIAFLSSTEKFSLTQWLSSPFSWGVSVATLVLIGAGSLLRIAKLSQGGLSVALMAGATPLDPATQDSKERILINVVEEMSIASGTSIPRVFVMKEELGINAFVAGTEPRNTILAVTQGTLEKLNRHELQGVIGHEFSHILNGDMKLNVKLMGVLAGILLIGQLGEFLLRGSRRRSYHRSYSRNRNESQLVPLGLALMVIGYVGLFFGRLIKAAISRQREFLADASSVQFTRNPEGIASALYAIQHYSGHALLINRHAEDMSHMCFGNSVKHRLNGLLSTHPPIEERVRSIDKALWPRLKARFRKRDENADIHEPTEPSTSGTSLAAQGLGFAANANNTPQPLNTDAIKSSIGSPSIQHQLYAHELHTAIPEPLKNSAHSHNSEQLLYAILLQENKSHDTALSNIKEPHESRITIRALIDSVANNDARFRLPLLDMTLATLKSKNAEQRLNVIKNCITLIKSDKRITLSEFVYSYLIQQALGNINKPARSIKSFNKVEAPLASLFSIIVQCSGDSKEKQSENYQQIMGYFSKRDFSQHLKQPPSPKTLNHALASLHRLTPLLKQPIIDACVDCILHDGKAVLKEIELLRAICEALDCPMPPVLLS